MAAKIRGLRHGARPLRNWFAILIDAGSHLVLGIPRNPVRLVPGKSPLISVAADLQDLFSRVAGQRSGDSRDRECAKDGFASSGAVFNALCSSANAIAGSSAY